MGRHRERETDNTDYIYIDDEFGKKKKKTLTRKVKVSTTLCQTRTEPQKKTLQGRVVIKKEDSIKRKLLRALMLPICLKKNDGRVELIKRGAI